MEWNSSDTNRRTNTDNRYFTFSRNLSCNIFISESTPSNSTKLQGPILEDDEKSEIPRRLAIFQNITKVI